MTLQAKPGDGDFGITREQRIQLLKDEGIAFAEVVLDALEAKGYTLYRKRRFNQPRREALTVFCTPEIAAEIRAYSELFPDASQVELGALFNVNPGRVSEALNGLR